jgi:cytochrome c-type biogenesis protein CcmE
MIASDRRRTLVRFGAAIVVVVVALGYLAWTGVEQSKSYYVTIKELQKMDGRYEKRLRVAGTVVAGSIRRQGTHVEFTLQENDDRLNVSYHGTEAPPDTFRDDSQALAEGTYGRDGIFHAQQLQAKCASKYAPQPEKPAPAGANNVAQQRNGNAEVSR